MQHREVPKTVKLPGALLPRAALVFHDPVESEQAHCRCVRVYLDLETSFLARCHGYSVAETQCFQVPAEGDHLLGERAPKVRGVTTGVESAKVGVQLAFRRPNAGLVSNDQGSIDGGDSTSVRGLSLNPAQDLVHAFQACDVAQA
jgi:hypothetical protein